MTAGPVSAGATPQTPGEMYGPGGVERRSVHASPRLKASLVPSITGIVIGLGGTRVNLVNISSSGVLIEGPERLKPGNEVKLVFEGGFSPSVVPSRVVRTAVTGIGRDGVLRYHVGLAFLTPVEVPLPEGFGSRQDPQPAVLPEEPGIALDDLAATLESSAIGIDEASLAVDESAIQIDESVLESVGSAAVLEGIFSSPEPAPVVPRNRW